MNNTRKTVLGVPVDVYNPDELMSQIKKALQENCLKTIFAVNAEKIMRARRDSEFLSILEQADFLLPDGFGPVVGLKLIHRKNVPRMSGFFLMQEVLALASQEKSRVFLLGSKPEVISQTAAHIRKKHPCLNLVGAQHGYIPRPEYIPLVDRINHLHTDILLVGMGSPRQEKWIHEHKKSLRVKICIGVGGSFDVLAGRVPLAPAWVSSLYLEWVYRLLKQPQRFKRQRVVPVFIITMLLQALRSRINGRTNAQINGK